MKLRIDHENINNGFRWLTWFYQNSDGRYGIVQVPDHINYEMEMVCGNSAECGVMKWVRLSDDERDEIHLALNDGRLTLSDIDSAIHDGFRGGQSALYIRERDTIVA